MSLKKLKIMLLETRPNFLLLTPAVSFVGISVVIAERMAVNVVYFLIAFFGALLVHIAVNVLNDYYDYLSGIDLKTSRTPFSGGSGILPSKLLEPKSVYILGISSLFIDLGIATYFYIIYGWTIWAFAITGFILSYFYTTLLTKLYLAEVSAGLGFALISLGIYFTQTGRISSLAAISSIIVGILVMNLLLLNEFPDTKADKEAGRRHIPAVLGLKAASRIYTILNSLLYILTVLFIVAEVFPLWELIIFISLPMAINISKGVMENCYNTSKLIPYMAKNIQLLFFVMTLEGIGLILNGLLI